MENEELMVPAEMGPEELRKLLMQQLSQKMQPVAAPDTAAAEAAAADQRRNAMLVKSGVALGNAFAGQGVTSGANAYSDNMDEEAKLAMAKAIEQRRAYEEAQKRREMLMENLASKFATGDAAVQAAKIRADAIKNKPQEAGSTGTWSNVGTDQATGEVIVMNTKTMETKKLPAVTPTTLSAPSMEVKNRLSEGTTNDLAQQDSALGKLDSLAEQAKTMFDEGGTTGRGKAFVEGAKEFAAGVGIPTTPPDEQYAKLRVLAQNVGSEYRRAISGLTVSDKEKADLDSQMPVVEKDSPKMFLIKLDAFKQALREFVNTKRAGLAASGRTVPGVAPAPAGDAAAKKKRLEELRAKKASK